jgi:uncharacterized delta-60 repeat protein
MKKIYFLVLTFCFLTIVQGQNPSDRDPNFNQFNLPINHYFVGKNVIKSEILKDGKILLLEDYKKLVRLEGNLFDNTFNTGKGFFADSEAINDFAVQSDGKVIVGGNFTSYNGINKQKLIRLNSDGSIDSNFNISFSTSTLEVLKIIILADGRIFLNTFENGYSKMKILNPNGSISFSYVLPTDYIYQGFAFQNDGKLIISRRGTSFLNFSYSCDVIRLNIDGSVDSSFNPFNLGSYYTGNGYDVSEIKKVQIQNDGSILVAGFFPGCLVKLNVSGFKDASFKANGGFGISGYTRASINDFTIQKDKKILIAGSFDKFNNSNISNLLRVSQDGDLDSDFLKIDAFSNIKVLNSVSLFSDEKILVSGGYLFDGLGDKQDNYILKLNTDGSKDNTFNNVCKGFFGVNTPFVVKVAETSDNKILVGGNFISYNGRKVHNFLRLNRDGSSDDTFNLEKFDIFKGDYNIATAILPLPDKKMLVGINFPNPNSLFEKCILKLNENGSIDSVFEKNSGNGFTIDNNRVGYISSILFLNNSSILVGGNFNVYNGTKCSSAVILDLDGNYKRNLWVNNSAVLDLKIQPDGKLLIFTDSNIFRYNTEFVLDGTFILDSKITNTKIRSIGVQADGKILMNGDFTVNGQSLKLIRISADGTFDDSFSLSRGNIFVNSFTVLFDQKIIVSYVTKDTYEYLIERFNNDGSVDSSFNKQLTEYGSNFDIYPQSDGGVFLYGYFVNYNEKPAGGLVRLIGEDYNYIIGENKYDLTNNGCDLSDPGVKNLKINFFSNGNSFDYITNEKGNFNVAVTKGNHKITPAFENPNYFIISPTSATITFPGNKSPFIQNFCVTANGIHPDLEVSILPLDRARPGFESSYKIIYKNKGTNTQSGKVNVTFNDAVLDFISSDRIISMKKTDNVSWDFINLKPFESKEIIFKIKVNTPTETPAVNNGDVLAFTANITSVATDETSKDNTFLLNQTVVGSYDPNDKTCLEGAVITPSLIGEYVHYMIRFENTGTYPAQNIVVKDMIDLTKFDISTLITTSSSHSFTTKISEGNKVEFIFENINLPFDDANNDGYVAFKIKTKPTLKVGDTFTNDANIYFDYNYPILTNKATSTFKTLGTQDFEFANYFTLYPNPANDILNISSTQDIEIKSFEIYDILGQLVIAVPNGKSVSNIDVSRLRTGNYFIKVKSDKGSSSLKFIKK